MIKAKKRDENELSVVLSVRKRFVAFIERHERGERITHKKNSEKKFLFEGEDDDEH
jgi:hypothetical protein